ncbi:hypothetical protein O4H52_07950 [Sphingomonadaceae bacterium G21617-S1]|nr:hypothetical protein [Sphingomonadaceae bacterium G21617-S1]
MLDEEPFCRWCIQKGTVTVASRSVICGHVLGLAEGGSNDRANLCGECEPCSIEKTAAEAARAQGRVAPVARRRRTIGSDGWPIDD